MDTMLPAYRPGERIREGGGARIHRGQRLADGLPVLVKRLVPEAAIEAGALRLRREYDLLARIDLPGVVKVLGLMDDEDGPALVMEDIGGEPLDRLLERTRLTLPQSLDLIAGLAETLAGLHRQGIIHQDINPRHIIYNPESGGFRLIGFTSAEAPSRRLVALLPPAALEGTLAYISPEQTGRMNRSLDYRTDFYSLGATFYQLLTGKPPFAAEDDLGLLHCHLAQEPVAPHDLDPAIPISLSRIVLKLLAKAAEERYQSGLGLKADLERCARGLRDQGDIPEFEPGLEDMPDRLRLPERLYGREEEMEQLLAALDRACGGGAELLLVAGYSGVGKTALVRGAHRHMLARRAFFIEGKFDQLQRHMPYSAWIHAFSGFVNYLLMADDAQLAAWRGVILRALGSLGRVLTEVIPNLDLVIGPQPEPPPLGATEARNRFNHLFLELVKAIASEEHPLVIFLDDLQWIDAASLELLGALLKDGGVSRLLVIGAFRDNEVSGGDLLTKGLDELRREQARIGQITLDNCSEVGINQLLAATLRSTPARTLPLTRLLRAKTGGNPFFLLRMLRDLAERRAIDFDPEGGHWQWDCVAIRGMAITDNVADLLLGKIRRLPPETRVLLELAACIGFRFDLGMLRAVAGQAAEGIRNGVQPAQEEELIVADGEGRYRFAHDRILEAVYGLIPAAERPAQHLRIGRLLLAHTPEAALGEHIFAITAHLNQGVALITEPGERQRLAELNLMAGRRAKAAAALAVATGHFAAGAALLPAAAWAANYELAAALLLEQAEGEYLIGNYPRSESLLIEAQGKVNSLPDQARVLRLRQRFCQLSGDFHAAMAVTLEALSRFGIAVPETDAEIRAATEAEIRLVSNNLGDRPIAALASVPLGDDAELRAVIGLLAEAMPLIYTVRPLLWPLVTAKGVNLSLERGNAEESPFVYSCYSMVLVAIHRDIPAAIAFSEMAIALGERLPGGAVWRGKLLFHHGSVVNIWGNPFAANLPLLDQAFQLCIDAGDFVHAGYLTYNAIWLHLESGAHLSEVVRVARRYGDFARRNHNPVVARVDRIEEQFALCLMGRTRSDTDLSDDTFDEAECVAAIEDAGFFLGIAYHRIMQLMAAYLAGRYEEALARAERAAPMLLQVASMANEATFHFYHALTLTALHGQVSAGRQREFMAILEDILEKLKFWAGHCPANFANRHALIMAEIARLENRDLEAMRLYEEAIGSAGEQGFTHHKALACEVAASFYRQRGYEKIARAYLAEAVTSYNRWGALGKARDLRRLHPWLPPIRPAAERAMAARLDAVSLAKAQQSISGEIRLDSLARTLLRIVMENAGAQSGYLSVTGNGQLRAEMRPGADGSQQVIFDPSPSEADLPEDIVNYVRRSRETVTLADAGAEAGAFSADAYLRRTRPRSVLCLAIQRREKLLGVLYLENNLVAGVFTSERRLVLEVLAAQAAVSLETAGLYEAMREDEERLRLTLESSRIGTWDWDVAHDIWTASPVYYTMLGYPPKEGRGDRQEWMARLHPDDRALFIEKMESVLATKEFDDYQYEARLLHADGSYRWQLVKGFGIKRDTEGRVTRMLGIRMDIHDRKQAEEEIKLLSLALDHVREGAFLIDLQGRFHYVNQEACRSLEYAREELIGKSVLDIDSNFSAAQLAENLDAIRKQGALTFESRHRTRSGRVFPVEITASRVEYGGTSYSLALVRDISERKQAEEERLRHLRFFEDMDRVHRAMQGESDLEERLGQVLDVVLAIFGCDRAYLHFPCDPDAARWRVPVERCRPAYPPVACLGDDMPMDDSLAGLLRLLLATDGPVQAGPDTPYPLSAEVAQRYNCKSFMAVALHPNAGPPWAFGIHQCSEARLWTAEEERLMRDIGRRLADGMTSLLMYRDLRESDRDLRRLKDELEQRVQERTVELLRNNEELERMNNLFVGRELRMIELKKRIKELGGSETHE